ncbi:MAG: DNA polymerase III subunit beta [Pseudomonadales bacterium]
MKFSVSRQLLLKPLQLVAGVVERRNTLPVLSNVLIETTDAGVCLTGTDLEVSVVARVPGVEVVRAGAVTIPARKLADIFRSLPDDALVSIELEEQRAVVRSGRSRYALATLPVSDFPSIKEEGKEEVRVTLEAGLLSRLIAQVGFSMAQQDVRYFLNGMLLELTEGHTRVVATDGHRLAMATAPQSEGAPAKAQAIVPRKGVLEMARLLGDEREKVDLILGQSQLTLDTGEYQLVTKLIDGRFPDYEKVVPKHDGAILKADRGALRVACQRASILSNEKYRGVRLLIESEQVTIQANNPEQEEALEVVPVEFAGEPLEIGFNVSYLQDVLGALETDDIQISIADANSSAVIRGIGNDEALYVVMPMRL